MVIGLFLVLAVIVSIIADKRGEHLTGYDFIVLAILCGAEIIAWRV